MPAGNLTLITYKLIPLPLYSIGDVLSSAGRLASFSVRCVVQAVLLTVNTAEHPTAMELHGLATRYRHAPDASAMLATFLEFSIDETVHAVRLAHATV